MAFVLVKINASYFFASTSEALNIGKSVGEELLKLAGSEFKKK